MLPTAHSVHIQPSLVRFILAFCGNAFFLLLCIASLPKGLWQLVMWTKCVIGLLCFFPSAIDLYAQDSTSNNTKSLPAPAKKDTLVKLKGSISLYSTIYHMDGNASRRSPFSWTISGNPVISIKGIVIPVRIISGEQNRYFRQSFNQAGISPRYKWLTLHLGYRNLYFSPFTLGGHTFLGTGLELNPGKWKMAFMYGRMRKAIGEDPLLPYNVIATYKRIGYGARISYGSSRNLIAISFFRARDDTSSLERNSATAGNRLTPSDNIVAGIQSKQQFGGRNGKSTLIWELDWAISAYNRDYRVQPLPTRKMGLWKPFRGLFQPTYSMQMATAGQTSLTLKTKDISTKVLYRRIAPDYLSMGAYYFQTDAENITIEPSWTMWKKKLSIQAGMGIQRDNLSNQRMSTTKRTIGSVNLSLVPNQKYALDVQLSNYGIAQKAGRNPLNDTTRMVQANKNISIINRYSSMTQQKAKTMILMLTYQQVSDLNTFSSIFNNAAVFFANLTYNQLWIPAGCTMNIAINHTTFNSYAGKTLLSGITTGIVKALPDNRLASDASVSVFYNVYKPNPAFATPPKRSMIFTLTSGTQYRINLHHVLHGNVNCIFNRAGDNESFSEITGVLGYTCNF